MAVYYRLKPGNNFLNVWILKLDYIWGLHPTESWLASYPIAHAQLGHTLSVFLVPRKLSLSPYDFWNPVPPEKHLQCVLQGKQSSINFSLMYFPPVCVCGVYGIQLPCCWLGWLTFYHSHFTTTIFVVCHSCGIHGYILPVDSTSVTPLSFPPLLQLYGLIPDKTVWRDREREQHCFPSQRKSWHIWSKEKGYTISNGRRIWPQVGRCRKKRVDFRSSDSNASFLPFCTGRMYSPKYHFYSQLLCCAILLVSFCKGFCSITSDLCSIMPESVHSHTFE